MSRQSLLPLVAGHTKPGDEDAHGKPGNSHDPGISWLWLGQRHLVIGRYALETSRE